MATRPETKDTNFLWELFLEKVNSDLNDTLGNFIHRTLTFINTQFKSEIPRPDRFDDYDENILKSIKQKVAIIGQEIEECRLQAAANAVTSLSRVGNQYLNEKEPWNRIERNRQEAANTIYVAAQIVKALAIVSAPFIPFAAEQLWKILNLPGSIHEQEWNEAQVLLQVGHKINKSKPLFQKIEADEQELDGMLEKVRERLHERT